MTSQVSENDFSCKVNFWKFTVHEQSNSENWLFMKRQVLEIDYSWKINFWTLLFHEKSISGNLLFMESQVMEVDVLPKIISGYWFLIKDLFYLLQYSSLSSKTGSSKSGNFWTFFSRLPRGCLTLFLSFPLGILFDFHMILFDFHMI